MPRTRVVFYQEGNGTVPLLEWFDEISIKAQDKCRLRIERLRDLGHELRNVMHMRSCEYDKAAEERTYY